MKKQNDFQVFQASAGSGKTYTLVKEYLKLCLRSDHHVDNFRHILAMTFTNAAANEMKAKIVKQLREIVDSSKPKGMEADLLNELELTDASLKKNAQELLTRIMHDYSSFCVCTIDSFVQKLSRTFAHDLGLSSQYQVSIDTDDMAETITDSFGAQITEDNQFLVKILRDFIDNQFSNQKSVRIEDKLSDFIKKLMTEKAYQKDENNNIHDLEQYRQTLAFLKGKTDAFENSIQQFVKDYKDVESKYDLSDEDFFQGGRGVGAYMRKLANKEYALPNSFVDTVIATGKWYSAKGERRFVKDELEHIKDELMEVLDPMRSFLDSEFPAYNFYNSQRNSLYLYALRGRIRDEFQRLAGDDELVHISEFNKLLSHVLGDFSVPFIYERMGEQYRHVFIDEFQDTSIMQWQNLLPLIDNGLSNGAMSMVVGDGKQSIYRFRSGEVGQIVSLPAIYALPDDERQDAFIQYQQNLSDNFEFHNLGTNFRSYENVVKFNNDFFDFARHYLSEHSQKVYVDENTDLGKSVSIHQENAKKEKGFVQVELYDAERQSDYCLERIDQLIHELTTEKGYQYSDITVLTRDNKFGSAIANYLNDKEIPVVSQVSILLKSSDKVQLIVNTLRYLIHGDNEAVVANVLYYWKLTHDSSFDGDIVGMFDDVKSIANGTKDIEPFIGLAELGILKATLTKATCLYDLCASLLRMFQFDTIRDAFLNYFMEEVFAWQNGISESITDFLDYWEKKKDKLAVKSVSGNAVNIMTIHKSKGLEFNVVIYPDAIFDLDEKINTSSAEEWLEPQELGFDPIPNLEKVLLKLGKETQSMGDVANLHVENEAESNRLDNLNLLYVAFTRAVQRLYVIAKQLPEKSNKEHIIHDYLSEQETVASESDSNVIYQLGDPEFRNPEDRQLDGQTSVDVDSASGDWFSKIQVDPIPSMFWISSRDKMQPNEWGELVHAILSEICTENDIEKALQPYLSKGVINEEVAGVLRDKFVQMARHPMICEAFGESAMVKNECEILVDGIIKRPDRFAELPDIIYLIDYKTGAKRPEYHTQLKQYISALQGMVEKDIRTFLVYLADSVEVEEVVMDTLF